jgi:hypothetical protein
MNVVVSGSVCVSKALVQSSCRRGSATGGRGAAGQQTDAARRPVLVSAYQLSIIYSLDKVLG